MLGVNYTDNASTDLDERVYSLEEIKDKLKAVIEAVKGGVNVDEYDALIDQCEDWLDEVDNDIKAVQDEIDKELKHAPRYGHTREE